MKVTVAGCGYVGLSLAILLSQRHEVIAYDISSDRVDKIYKKDFPIQIDQLKSKNLNLKATQDEDIAFKYAQYVFICTPTDYNEKNNAFDTSAVESIIQKVVLVNKDATIIIKSTIPIGFTEEMRKKYNYRLIVFSPEFLREDKAIYDNMYPSRIIVGELGVKGEEIALLLKSISLNQNVKIKLMNSTEAEAVKLFSNAFLALRVSYFNEMDTFAELKGLDIKKIISGVSLDPRIGDYYNNPSFGYGGYCLTKGTKQLKADYEDIPENIISAIINSNDTRKKHIVNMILDKKPKVVGVYRLIMKTNSTNFRESAVLDIIKKLKENKISIIIYEPNLYDCKTYCDCKVINKFDKFKKEADLIIANRIDEKIKKLEKKVYSRDNRD